jgi:hypothetical protein
MRSNLHAKTNTLAIENEIKETLSHEEMATVTFRNNDDENSQKGNDHHLTLSNKDRATVTG